MKTKPFSEIKKDQAFQIVELGPIYYKDHCEGAYRFDGHGGKIWMDFIPADQQVIAIF